MNEKPICLRIGFFIPGNMKELTEQELHNLAMNIVGKELEAEGYEFMGVNSKLRKNPQFVCLKDKSLHFIVVRNIPYPEDPGTYDEALMAKVKEHALKFEARTYYAGVGISNAADRSQPVLLNQEYLVHYEGLVEI
jgi:hypothetical protein